ncbi:MULTISPECIES: host attachment protein [unclassified Novosphingobium]|uniref:host attachment protein n=1 Tax=unclassified Novosphingobium TaxID=2644732 RepID=UPI000ECD1870|nr:MULTISPECIES: host attachment protein [unclassified Novosphingobium]HCF25425.1 attachment protein [Novosphingobium sp.]HQV04181.1 host attachment protein [Novosphingobium sp.]
MLLPHGAIVAIADGENFELYRNTGNEAEPELAAQPVPKLDSSNHSGGSHRSSPGNHADSIVGEDAHAAAVATWLNGQVLSHKIKDLVVVAPPRTLGELRKHYHKMTGRAVIKELHKDLIGKQPSDILIALREKH